MAITIALTVWLVDIEEQEVDLISGHGEAGAGGRLLDAVCLGAVCMHSGGMQGLPASGHDGDRSLGGPGRRRLFAAVAADPRILGTLGRRGDALQR